MRLSKARRVIAPHRDIDAVARAVRDADGAAWVVVESVFSMDGDLAPLADLAQLCADHGARLVVDEAHATGMFGPEGQGRVVAEGLRDGVFASIHTCGKALGLVGAVVVGSADLREALLNLARPVIFATASPPFLAAGLAAAIELVASDPALRARPGHLGARLREALDGVDTGASESHIVPVITGAISPTMALADGLRARGWDARPIRPPTVPDGACRVRLVLHAALSDADVDRLAADVRSLS
jgi:8-amino-7-oxononanoate synthase